MLPGKIGAPAALTFPTDSKTNTQTILWDTMGFFGRQWMMNGTPVPDDQTGVRVDNITAASDQIAPVKNLLMVNHLMPEKL